MTALTTTNNQFAPATIDEAIRLSEMLSKSSMVPKAYQGKPEDILVATIWGREMGLATLQALQNIAVINGKPSVYGDAMMALVQASPICEGVDEHIEGEGTPNPVAVCVARRKGRMPVVAKFSVEDAKRAGLWGKQGPWQAYPKRMLQMRARGFALRDAFPDVLKGLITAEEAQDFPSDEPRQMRDVTPAKPANPLDAIAPPRIEQTSDPIIIEQQLADTVDPEPVQQVEVDDAMEEELEREAIIAESGNAPGTPGFAMMVPGQDKPLASYPTIDEWVAAYEALADKTAKAGRSPARVRMTKLRQLREVNETMLGRVPMVARTAMMGSYNRRISALGAMLTPEERAAESGQA